MDGSAPALVRTVVAELQAGRGVGIHCRIGVGRLALVACCVMARLGAPISAAWSSLHRSRGLSVPDTGGQRGWVLDWLTDFIEGCEQRLTSHISRRERLRRPEPPPPGTPARSAPAAGKSPPPSAPARRTGSRPRCPSRSSSSASTPRGAPPARPRCSSAPRPVDRRERPQGRLDRQQLPARPGRLRRTPTRPRGPAGRGPRPAATPAYRGRNPPRVSVPSRTRCHWPNRMSAWSQQVLADRRPRVRPGRSSPGSPGGGGPSRPAGGRPGGGCTPRTGRSSGPAGSGRPGRRTRPGRGSAGSGRR